VTTSTTVKRPIVAFVCILLTSSAGAQRAPGSGGLADRPITFTKDVAPILYRQCAQCHQPGGPAPFSLITYDEVRRHAAQIADVTTRRYMPPWKPESGFGDFVGERHLSDVQIQTIARWVAGGRLEGDRADLPSAPAPHSGWQLGTPDLVVMLPE
jgi:hypothetical protein